MSQTVDALGTRLSPGELIDQFIGTAREHGGELTRNFGGQVKQNPVPALLTTVGIAWMMAGSNSSADSAVNFNGVNGASDDSWSRSNASDDGSSIGETVKSKLEAGKDKLAAGRDKLAEGRESAADRIDSVKSSASDQATERAKQLAAEQYERGREKAKQTAQNVKETVREQASTTATDYAQPSFAESLVRSPWRVLRCIRQGDFQVQA